MTALDSWAGVAVTAALVAATVALLYAVVPDDAFPAPLWTQVLGWALVFVLRSDRVQRLLGGGRLDNRLLLRLGVGCGAFAAVLWPTGMSFLVPLFAALVTTVHMSWSGARAWRAGTATTLAVTLLSQLAVRVGWQPSVLDPGVDEVVAGTALLAAVALIGNAALLTAQREAAAQSLETERRDRHEDLLHAATHDPLTGLLNRAGIFRVLEDHLEQGTQERRTGPDLLFIDLDDFKPVNDAFGHAAGDEVLQLVAQRLQGLLRHHDRVARLGGDEFVVALLPRLGPAELDDVADRVQAALSAPFPLAGTTVHISASVGAAAWRAGATSVDEQVHRADAAMYEAKARRVSAPAGGLDQGLADVPQPTRGVGVQRVREDPVEAT